VRTIVIQSLSYCEMSLQMRRNVVFQRDRKWLAPRYQTIFCWHYPDPLFFKLLFKVAQIGPIRGAYKFGLPRRMQGEEEEDEQC
jgi:hypothetical protein